MSLEIKHFFDTDSCTYSYVVSDSETRQCAVIDSVLDYDAAAGRTTYDSADQIIAYVREQELKVEWILETHVHADHLSAAPYIRQQLGGQMAIGAEIKTVQEVFGKLFNAGPDFPQDGSQFDRLWQDGDTFSVGGIQATAIHTPGHTPACISYLIGDSLFVGDTLFMHDFGTARCDFPGGSANDLWHSIRKLYQLPDETRMFMCHDYKAPGRDDYAFETTVGKQRALNPQGSEEVSEEEFVKLRSERDATLGAPRLLLPSVQVNMRAGHLPEAEDNGISYVKIPLNQI
ncbi:MAG: MBL fold metallo-hydrolase [Granulosicoccaceae bacterium]